MTLGIVIFVSLVVLLVLGIPIAIAIGGAVVVGFAFSGTNFINLVQRMYAGVDSFTLMAIPFFMVAGSLMETGGMSKRLIRFANSLVGGLAGGLAHVQVLASAFFAALSGSAPATTAAIGGALIPDMKEQGYPPEFSAGVQAVAGTIGTIIPPSIPMVVYGVAAQVSIGELFAAGFVPGFIYAGLLMVLIYVISKKRGYTNKEYKGISGKEVWASFKDAVWALLVPVIILGGIYSGVFTPTEAGAVAAAYGLFAGLVIYRELNFKQAMLIFVKSAANTAMVLLIIAAASGLSWILSIKGVAALIGQGFASVSNGAPMFMGLTILLLLFLGCFMETTASILMVTPILLPVATSFGINPIYFGIVMTMTLSLGMATPPVGENLYIAASIAGIKFEDMLKNALPFIIAAIVAILIVTAVPQVCLFLPGLLY